MKYYNNDIILILKFYIVLGKFYISKILYNYLILSTLEHFTLKLYILR